MSVIRLTKADLLSSMTLEKGGYPAILKEMVSEASKAQKSINHKATFQITDGPALGKEIDVWFNTAIDQPSLLGGLYLRPVGDIAKLYKAITGENVQADTDIDGELLKGKPFDLLINVETSGGNLVNIVTGFAPLGKSKGVPF